MTALIICIVLSIIIVAILASNALVSFLETWRDEI